MKQKALFTFVAVLLIVTAVLSVYYNSLEVPFQFDDNRTVVRNNTINKIDSVPRFIRLMKKQRPFFNLSLALDTHFFGKKSRPYHVTNIIIHICNSVLVFLLISLMIGRNEKLFSFPALAGALLFSVHPLGTESVTYITGRAELLAGFFILLSLYCYAKFLERKKYFYYLIAFLSFPIGLGCKESAAIIPFVLILYCLCFTEYDNLKRFVKKQWKGIVPFFAIIVGGVIFAFYYFGGITSSSSQYSSYTYLINQFKVVLIYLKLILVPVGLSVDHYVKLSSHIFTSSVLFSLFVIVALLILLFMVRKKAPSLTFTGLLFFLFLVPSSSVVPLGDLMAEHRAYLSIAAFCMFIVLFYGIIRKSSSFGKIIEISGTVLLVIMLGTYSYLTYSRNIVWQSEATLWEDAVKKSEGKIGRPLVNVAKAYLAEGKVDKALDSYKKALDFDDTYKPRVYLGMGYIYFQAKRDVEKAQDYFQLAVKSANPPIPEAYVSLGNIFWQKKQYSKALEYMSKGYGKMKSDPIVNFVMGDCYLELGDYDKSNYYFGLALKRQPGNFFINLKLGELKIRQEFWNEAAKFLGRALEIRPNSREVMEKINYVEQMRQQ